MKPLRTTAMIVILAIISLASPTRAADQAYTDQAYTTSSADTLVKNALNKIILNQNRPRMIANTRHETNIYDPNAYHNNQNPWQTTVKNEVVVGYPKLEGLNAISIYGALVNKFEFSYENRDQIKIVSDRECVVIKFKPKSGLPVVTASDNTLNRLTGYIYIDRKSGSMVAINGWADTSKEPIYFTYYVLGFLPLYVSIYTLDFWVDYTTVNGMDLEHYLGGTTEYKTSGIWNRPRRVEKHEYVFSNYR